MIQNIKTDVVYYKTNTDFEMEFNLCGCCRMRLLTDKSAERKSFVANLARAVSRSSIIIVVGSLFGEDNIINNVAEAIGKKIKTVDNKTYGINSSDEIDIIAGAVPLVTNEGIFGGCIIESGPQTMILLSESKNVRKSIMNSLVHQYIREIYADGIKETTVEETTEESAVETEKVNVIEEDIKVETEAECEEEIEAEIPHVQESQETKQEDEEKKSAEAEIEEDDEPDAEEDEVETNEDDEDNEDEDYDEEDNDEEDYDDEDNGFTINGNTVGLFTEPKKIRKRESKYYNEAYSDFALENEGFIKDDEYDGYYKQHSKSKITIIIISILILIALAVISYCIFYVPSKDGVSATAYIKEIYDTLFG